MKHKKSNSYTFLNLNVKTKPSGRVKIARPK